MVWQRDNMVNNSTQQHSLYTAQDTEDYVVEPVNTVSCLFWQDFVILHQKDHFCIKTLPQASERMLKIVIKIKVQAALLMKCFIIGTYIVICAFITEPIILQINHVTI